MIGFLLRLIPGYSTLVALAQFSVGVLYPTFESFKSIESSGTSDDTQWLSYWVVYAVLSLVEKIMWPVLVWIPLYSLLKTAALAWLVLPQFLGATFVYQNHVRPLLMALAAKARENPTLEPYVRDFTKPLDTKSKEMKTQIDAAVSKAQEVMNNVAEKTSAGIAAAEEEVPMKAHAQ